MDINELKGFVDLAIDDCEHIILQNPRCVLSESDFEKLLCQCIAKRIGYNPCCPDPNGFSVHTQISHYPNDIDMNQHENEKRDAQVDMLLLKESELMKCHKNKREQYRGDSIALELKYRHDTGENDMKAVFSDMKKMELYKDDSILYVVALFDYVENKEGKDINELKKDIENIIKKERAKNGFEGELHCHVLIKDAN